MVFSIFVHCVHYYGSSDVHADGFTVTTLWGKLQFFHQQTGEIKCYGEALWGSPKNWSKNTKNIIHII